MDAIWLTPIFPSPQVDFGYDVADYDGVDPSYGTLADVDALIRKGRARGVKLILDLVINHSSDHHRWFVASRSGRSDPQRDWYVWRDAKAGGGVPNNWTSYFGGPAWTWDAKTGQYYYHIFAPEQPDLNWRNPAVETAMFAAAEWWLKRGVYGYRLDAVDAMFERADLADEPTKPGTDAFGMPNQSNIHKANQPETHSALQRLRANVIDRYPGRVLIGETYPTDTADLVRHYGPANNEIQLPMYLSLIGDQPLQAADLRARIAAVEANPVGGWPCFALGNHDKTRVASRLPLPRRRGRERGDRGRHGQDRRRAAAYGARHAGALLRRGTGHDEHRSHAARGFEATAWRSTAWPTRKGPRRGAHTDAVERGGERGLQHGREAVAAHRRGSCDAQCGGRDGGPAFGAEPVSHADRGAAARTRRWRGIIRPYSPTTRRCWPTGAVAGGGRCWCC